ncbi:AI-2E family transporter [Haloplanus sp.]|uniref:AI-2E family transporter n=1 Tax=Haloplanus sp. TaxID=1961696 RepID=UPI00263481E1|nr:AI-2E family transporter [Haloplanus sp.]
MSFLNIGRYRLGWWGFGVALGAALTYVVYSFVGTFVFGVFIYYATRPIYRRVRRVIRQPSLAAAVSLLALTLPAFLLVAYALSIVLNQLRRYAGDGTGLVSTLPFVDSALIRNVADPATLLELDPTEYLTGDGIASALASLGSAADTVAFLGVGAIHLFVMFALAFYLLRDGSRLSRWSVNRFGDNRGLLRSYGEAVDRDFKAIFFGNILNAVFTGTIGVLVYSVLNVYAPAGVAIPAAALVGLLAGVASLVPMVGMKLVYVPVAAYLGVASLLSDPNTLWFVAVFTIVSFVVVDTIPDLLLRPYVSGRSLHVGSLMIAYTLGPLLFGWYGIFLGPMLLVTIIHFSRTVLPELMTADPVRPFAVDPGTFAPSDGLDDATAEDAAGGAGD